MAFLASPAGDCTSFMEAFWVLLFHLFCQDRLLLLITIFSLNLLPVSGGAPKVIAYIYGGQGTLNVNPWSPDSKKIAFVSNSGKLLREDASAKK